MNDTLQQAGNLASQTYTIEGMILVFGVLISLVVLGVLLTLRSQSASANGITNTITTILGSQLKQALEELTQALKTLNTDEGKRNAETVRETDALIGVIRGQNEIVVELTKIAEDNNLILKGLRLESQKSTERIITNLDELKEISNGTKQLVEEKAVKMFEEKFQRLMDEIKKLSDTVALLVTARVQDSAKITELTLEISKLQAQVLELQNQIKQETDK